MENHQEFLVKEVNNNWRIVDSYNVLADFLDFDVVDKKWGFYWDKEKHDVLMDLQKKLVLKTVIPGHCGFFDCSIREGKLKLINNSDYDIKGVKILIEHYDKKGKSVNTDDESVYDIVRKHGSREVEWYTSECSSCAKQEFKINFIRESN